jgi:hypothetical protein
MFERFQRIRDGNKKNHDWDLHDLHSPLKKMLLDSSFALSHSLSHSLFLNNSLFLFLTHSLPLSFSTTLSFSFSLTLYLSVTQHLYFFLFLYNSLPLSLKFSPTLWRWTGIKTNFVTWHLTYAKRQKYRKTERKNSVLRMSVWAIIRIVLIECAPRSRLISGNSSR